MKCIWTPQLLIIYDWRGIITAEITAAKLPSHQVLLNATPKTKVHQCFSYKTSYDILL